MTKPKTIGQYIKQLVAEEKLTLTDFAKMINTTIQNVRDIFTRSTIDSELLLKISKALNKNVFSYFDDEEPIVEMKAKEKKALAKKFDSFEENIHLLKSELSNAETHIQELMARISDQEDVIRLLKEKEQFLNNRN